MSDPVKISKAAQFWMLALGLFLISISLIPAISYIKTGVAEITMRHTTYTGPVAALEIIGFLVGGLAIVISAVRKIRK